MNKTQRILLSQLNARRVKRWEGIFTRQINNALRSEVAKVVDVLKAEGVDEAKRKADSILMIEGLSAVIRRLYVFVGLAVGNRALRGINKSARSNQVKAGFGFDEEWTNAILNYFKLHLLTKAVIPISQETRRLIFHLLNQGIKEGWGIDKIARELLAPDFTLKRARLIARTEIVKAQFFGEELGVEQSEWETDEMWISAHDHRVRSSHRKVDGDTIQSGGRFKVDRVRNNVVVGYDMMKGPGDPTASIENVANCRCVRSVVVRRDERGRLIRKQKKLVALPREFAT